jgi:hypothetical protein
MGSIATFNFNLVYLRWRTGAISPQAAQDFRKLAQVLTIALTGKVGPGTQLTGNPTNRGLAYRLRSEMQNHLRRVAMRRSL